MNYFPQSANPEISQARSPIKNKHNTQKSLSNLNRMNSVKVTGNRVFKYLYKNIYK